MKQFDNLYFIGRFQPLHNEHVRIMEYARTIANNVVTIIGSDKSPRTPKNPFTTSERIDMILQSLTYRPTIYAVMDNPSDEIWANSVRKILRNHDGTNAIIGFNKDESSFYLSMFPELQFVDAGCHAQVNATDIRTAYFNGIILEGEIPLAVTAFLEHFKLTEEYELLCQERAHLAQCVKANASYQYPPTYVTADAVVTCGDKVLMITRKNVPGKGLLAFPGGYLNANSDNTVFDAMKRELNEETGIDLTAVGHTIQSSKVFDLKGRSPRGRIITHAWHVELQHEVSANAADDAADAKWHDISSINPAMCFEDHWHILQHFIKESV